MSCSRNMNFGLANNGAMLSRSPVSRLSTQMTSWPSRRKRSQRCDPMKPAPPVTRMRAISALYHRRTSDREIREAHLAHRLRFPKVSAVEDHRFLEHSADAIEIGTAKFVPLGNDEQSIGTVDGFVVLA